MSVKMIFFIPLIFIFVGCAAGPKKQAAQPQPAESRKTPQQEPYSWGEDGDWLSDDYGKPAKKSYSEPAMQLNPKQIQRALKDSGFYQGPIDGRIGPKTKEAIIRFQKANGLRADGIVGRSTSAALNKYLSR